MKKTSIIAIIVSGILLAGIVVMGCTQPSSDSSAAPAPGDQSGAGNAPPAGDSGVNGNSNNANPGAPGGNANGNTTAAMQWLMAYHKAHPGTGMGTPAHTGNTTAWKSGGTFRPHHAFGNQTSGRPSWTHAPAQGT